MTKSDNDGDAKAERRKRALAVAQSSTFDFGLLEEAISLLGTRDRVKSIEDTLSAQGNDPKRARVLCEAIGKMLYALKEANCTSASVSDVSAGIGGMTVGEMCAVMYGFLMSVSYATLDDARPVLLEALVVVEADIRALQRTQVLREFINSFLGEDTLQTQKQKH